MDRAANPLPDRVRIFTQTVFRLDRTEYPDDFRDTLFQIAIDDLLEGFQIDIFDNQCDASSKGVGPKVRM